MFTHIKKSCRPSFTVFSNLSAALCPSSRVVVVASSLWQPLLPAGGAADLYDTEHDEWLFESEGALAAFIISVFPQSIPGLDCVTLVFLC